ncbi:MAG TPA: metalloregulator ArsR/SmtB family transcription factor [Candidatus Limnocylindrales bacterium]|nr:metalloregulator ArsR/SmtB family transcription factor [Candidatus Limnocylindrales bacterium]
MIPTKTYPIERITDMAALLKAMGHPVRLHILCMLRSGDLCVCHIERVLNRRQAYISQQLMVLRDSGAVTSQRDGLQVYYRLADPRIETLLTAAGAPAPIPPYRIEGCPCPACMAISVNEIG